MELPLLSHNRSNNKYKRLPRRFLVKLTISNDCGVYNISSPITINPRPQPAFVTTCGAGAIGIQKPIFCNAANMAYSKDVIEIFNRVSDSKIASGDDVFLLHYLKKTNTNAIKFALDEKAIVTTSSKENISDFLNQRKRWTAKSASYDDLFTLFVSILVLLVNFSFIYILFDSLFTYNYNFLFLFFAMKFICDYLILKPALIFFKKENLTKWILVFEFFYSLYVIFIVVMSFTTKFKWKDRIYKK